jgi:hypothetical protein
VFRFLAALPPPPSSLLMAAATQSNVGSSMASQGGGHHGLLHLHLQPVRERGAGGAPPPKLSVGAGAS